MGLKSSPNGVKAQLRDRFPRCFKEFDNVADARDAVRATRDQTVICTDGNVLMMGVPASCNTLESYVNMVTSILRTSLATSSVVVVVFDNPDAMTEAKKEEQARRDASKKSTTVVCSQDFQDVPVNDNYNKQYIERSFNVQTLVTNRETRGRFFDTVCVEVLSRLQSQIDRWNASGYSGGTVVFDGIDERGADRPAFEKRSPGFVSTNSEIASLFARDVEVGEGDIKLRDNANAIRKARLEGKGFTDVRIVMTTTIDTDSIAIELMNDSRLVVEDDRSGVSTLLVMRERATKRGTCEEKPARHLCCDVTLLNQQLQNYMWGIAHPPSSFNQRNAICMLVAGFALAGCDFVECKGLRADFVLDGIKEVIKYHSEDVEFMQYAFTGDRVSMAMLRKPIKKLMSVCASRMSEKPRMKKSADSVRNVNDVALSRASWVAAYWGGCEIKGNLEDFGFFPSFPQAA
jgi:hypothetical protein